MLTNDWLCKTLGKLNLTLVEGYPSRSPEAGGLFKDQFLRSVKSQSKWNGLYSNQKADSTAVSSWNTDASRLNSSYSRIARQAGLASTLPTLRNIFLQNLQNWEKCAREACGICNQAVSYNSCLFKAQLRACRHKAIWIESKGKSTSKVTDEL